MKNRKMIRKMISNKDEAIGSDFKHIFYQIQLLSFVFY